MLRKLAIVSLITALACADAHAQSVAIQSSSIPNNGTTATVLNELATYTGAPSTATVATSSQTNGVQGIVTANAGTTGNPVIARLGVVPCVFDATATVAGDWVVASATGGKCADSSVASTSAAPVGTIGKVLSTNSSGGGTYNVDLTIGYASSGASGANPTATIGASAVNGSATTFLRSDGAPAIGTNAVTNALLAQAGANTLKGNNTGSTANVTDMSVPSCADSGGNHLNWTSGTGLSCGTTSSGGGSANLSAGYVAGDWYVPYLQTVSTGNGNTMAATTAYCFPGALPAGNGQTSMTIEGLGAEIQTNGSSNIQLAIYNTGTNGRPSTLVGATGNISDTSGTVLTGALTSNKSVNLGQTYWFCIQANDTTAVMKVLIGLTGVYSYGSSAIGSATAGSVLSTGNPIVGILTTTGITSFGTWPSFAGATWTDDVTGRTPIIMFQVVSVP